MAAAAILNFREMSITLDWIHQSLWEYAPLPRGDDQLTKSRNRKLIREISSNECLEHKCVDLSDYRVLLPSSPVEPGVAGI